jgi:hypothetical protein
MSSKGEMMITLMAESMKTKITIITTMIMRIITIVMKITTATTPMLATFRIITKAPSSYATTANRWTRLPLAITRGILTGATTGKRIPPPANHLSSCACTANLCQRFERAATQGTSTAVTITITSLVATTTLNQHRRRPARIVSPSGRYMLVRTLATWMAVTWDRRSTVTTANPWRRSPPVTTPDT